MSPEVNPYVLQHIARQLRILSSEIPRSTLSPVLEPHTPARALIDRYAVQSGLISGGLALPPGPFGLVTILPDLAILWRNHIKMIADLAALHDKTQHLVPEVILYCLFEHTTTQPVCDFMDKMGSGITLERSSWHAIQKLSEACALRVAQRLARIAISRYVPIVGAVAIAAYAYRETRLVGKNALYFLENETIIMEDGQQQITVGE